MEKSDKILILSSIVLVGFTIAVVYHYILGNYLGMDGVFKSFLYPSFGAFSDFKGSFPYLKTFTPYHSVNLWIVYFPLAYILTLPFAFMKNWVISYVIYILGFLGYLIFGNTKSFACENLTKIENFKNIFILTCMSYPVLYILDKGNFDMFLFVVLGLFAYAFKSNKYMLGAILLGIANAIKPFTILFLFLFLFKKKYKEFFLSIILSSILIVGGFMVFKDNFFEQISNFIKIWALYQHTFVYANDNILGMGYGSSLFMPLKLIFCKMTATPLISTILLSKFYDYLSLIITAFTMFFVWREKSFWKQLTLLICNFLLIPSLTYDYKLIFLFIPIWLFVNEKEQSKFSLAYTILFGLLLIPKHFIITQTALTSTMTPWFSLSIIINPLILILLSLLIIYEQFYVKKTN